MKRRLLFRVRHPTLAHSAHDDIWVQAAKVANVRAIVGAEAKIERFFSENRWRTTHVLPQDYDKLLAAWIALRMQA